ncbi:hypothetical protein GO495_25140 [Chitinophaga oryziterrae]|uniref:Peptidase S74 domain-containing protein n=1 Tax=Chitinophaga oryziterrae TaxID=1031224 RepID=A0A6N8JF09_9BACT|nr:hypothetical protein [Chitinophaga oryziterrae]MVT43905.1 hypothetical protein [Chitinophaga oryziterrae]
MYLKFIPVTIILCFCFVAKSFSQSWNDLGPGYQTSDPYPFYYFKIATVNAATDRYATIIEVSAQGDANYFDQQGTFTVRIDKYENSGARFDGVEVRNTSGNPFAATFYISNNAIWVKSTYLWGRMYYRVIADFIGNSSPLVTLPIVPTTSAPVTTFVSNGFGIKCDFDNNVSYQLPFIQTNGSTILGQGVAMNSKLINTQDRPAITTGFIAGEINGFSGAGQTADDGFLRLSAGGGTTAATKTFIDISGYTASATNDRYENIILGTQGLERVRVDGSGNVGIGTKDAHGYKLAVNGAGIFTKVVVKNYVNWPDYVFDSSYHLPTLESVEKYVTVNKHLQGIPNAATIENENVDLGAMQSMLLKKMEEVTLYLIELKKENNALREEVRQLKAKY